MLEQLSKYTPHKNITLRKIAKIWRPPEAVVVAVYDKKAVKV